MPLSSAKGREIYRSDAPPRKHRYLLQYDYRIAPIGWCDSNDTYRTEFFATRAAKSLASFGTLKYRVVDLKEDENG